MSQESEAPPPTYFWPGDAFIAAGLGVALAVGVAAGVITPRVLIVLMCCEAALVGIRHVAMTGLAVAAGRGPWFDGVVQALFFCVHYGLFCAASLAFALLLASGAPIQSNPDGGGFSVSADDMTRVQLALTAGDYCAFLLVIAWHGLLLKQFIERRNVRGLTNAELMGEPYLRLFLQTWGVISIGGALLADEAPRQSFAMLPIYKASIDIGIIAWKARAQWLRSPRAS